LDRYLIGPKFNYNTIFKRKNKGTQSCHPRNVCILEYPAYLTFPGGQFSVTLHRMLPCYNTLNLFTAKKKKLSCSHSTLNRNLKAKGCNALFVLFASLAPHNELMTKLTNELMIKLLPGNGAVVDIRRLCR